MREVERGREGGGWGRAKKETIKKKSKYGNKADVDVPKQHNKQKKKREM